MQVLVQTPLTVTEFRVPPRLRIVTVVDVWSASLRVYWVGDIVNTPRALSFSLITTSKDDCLVKQETDVVIQ